MESLSPRQFNWNYVVVAIAGVALMISLYLFYVVGTWANYLDENYVVDSESSLAEERCELLRPAANVFVKDKANALGIAMNASDIASAPFIFNSPSLDTCVALFALTDSSSVVTQHGANLETGDYLDELTLSEVLAEANPYEGEDQ